MESLLHTSSFILQGHAQEHFWQGIGTLSLKTFCSGQALYRVDDGYIAVDDASYLLLNHAQPYTIIIDAWQPVESFCVFFAAGFAEDVARSLSASNARLLDEPTAALPALHFFERTYPHDAALSALLAHLRHNRVHCAADPFWLQEQLHRLMRHLLRVHQQVWREVEDLPAARPATREELYRRLHRARDYAAALAHTPLTLDDLARVACLSPNHFLRTFKAAFHQTPHQYLTSRRLEQASHLLRHTDLSVTEICFAVGFQSLGSFSWLFRRKVGLSPEAFRRQKR
ncbi:MAG TPA: AraC family transcriptional regulator [Ktedonobacterales bacterium]|nr:AraC family transcriptional regulator [Ktedonobacterales bacterium]